MQKDEVVDLISKELGYNRFCGTIAANNESHRLDTKEQCEMADVLASNNLSIFRDDALHLLKRIIDGIECDQGLLDITELSNYVKKELVHSRAMAGESISDITQSDDSDEINEITNPIMSLEV